MHRHLQVTSETDMIDKIFEFLEDITDSKTIKVGGQDGFKINSVSTNRIIWFLRDNLIGNFNVWITDVGETYDFPWECPSTMALAARYKIDLSRIEPDSGETATGKSEMNSELAKAYARRRKDCETATDLRNEYDIYRMRQREINKNYMIFNRGDPKWYRVDGVNMFHVCTTLNYSKVTTEKSYKWLDCSYTDGNFMFALYSEDIPNTTVSLVVGDFPTYSEEDNQCFLFANSFVMRSQTAYSSPNSGFFLEDKWGLGRETRSKSLYSLAKDEMERLREAAEDAVADYENAKAELEAKKKEIEDKKDEIKAKQEEIDKVPERRQWINSQIDTCNHDIYNTQQSIQECDDQIAVVTDPNELANLYRLKYQYEQQLDDLQTQLQDLKDQLDALDDEEQKLKDELDTLNDELADLYDELNDLQDKYDKAKDNLDNAEKKWCLADDSAYMRVYDKAVDAQVKDEDYQHTKKNITPEKYQYDYEAYYFAGLRFDADYDKDGDAEYCINHTEDGEDEWYAFRWHINPQYLKVWNLYPPYSPSWPVIRTLTSQKHVAWEYQLGHLTYEEYEQTDTPNYQSQLDLEKEDYEVSDVLRDRFKNFTFFKRCGYGGDSVNHPNNVSELMPIIWYVQRDDEQRNDWSAIGQDEHVCYINMYNMGTGRLLQPMYPEPKNRYVCYNLYQRRNRWIDHNNYYNDVKDSLTEIFGVGGYPGIGFRLKEKESLDELRRRVRQ